MTPHEEFLKKEATKYINKFYIPISTNQILKIDLEPFELILISFKYAKQCASIAINDVLTELRDYDNNAKDYYLDIKKTIEKL